MKSKIVLATLCLCVTVFVGCNQPATAPTREKDISPTQSAQNDQDEIDVVTTASIVDTEEAFIKAISKEGTWIIATTKNITTEEELILEGEFTNDKQDEEEENDIVQRKIALYTQDDNRNITERFTLTAPKLTVTSPNASIQKGIFIGDLYVAVNGFELVDNKIVGNVYFASEEVQSTFVMDDTSEVTGEMKLVE